MLPPVVSQNDDPNQKPGLHSHKDYQDGAQCKLLAKTKTGRKL